MHVLPDTHDTVQDITWDLWLGQVGWDGGWDGQGGGERDERQDGTFS